MTRDAFPPIRVAPIDVGPRADHGNGIRSSRCRAVALHSNGVRHDAPPASKTYLKRRDDSTPPSRNSCRMSCKIYKIARRCVSDGAQRGNRTDSDTGLRDARPEWGDRRDAWRRKMQRPTTSMRTAAGRIVSLASGLAATGPAFAAELMPDVDWHSCLDWHSYTDWHRLLLVASIVLLLAALVLNSVQANDVEGRCRVHVLSLAADREHAGPASCVRRVGAVGTDARVTRPAAPGPVRPFRSGRFGRRTAQARGERDRVRAGIAHRPMATPFEPHRDLADTPRALTPPCGASTV